MQASKTGDGELKKALLEYFETMSYKMESWARTNKPWTDQTGDAKRGLLGYSADDGENLILGVGHTVEYGESLETGHDKRYGILEPMLEHFQSDVIDGVSTITKAFCIKEFDEWKM